MCRVEPISAQSVERRWQRFLVNVRIQVSAIYVPLVLAALGDWKGHRLALALDTTVLWERALHDSPVSRVLWTSRPPIVASLRACLCNGGIR